MTMRITITEINSQNKMDLPLHDQPYEVIGRMKLRFDGQWSYTEELTEHPFSKTFPEEEDERDEFITADHKTAFLAYADQVCVGDIRLRCDWNLYAFIERCKFEIVDLRYQITRIEADLREIRVAGTRMPIRECLTVSASSAIFRSNPRIKKTNSAK